MDISYEATIFIERYNNRTVEVNLYIFQTCVMLLSSLGGTSGSDCSLSSFLSVVLNAKTLSCMKRVFRSSGTTIKMCMPVPVAVSLPVIPEFELV